MCGEVYDFLVNKSYMACVLDWDEDYDEALITVGLIPDPENEDPYFYYRGQYADQEKWDSEVCFDSDYGYDDDEDYEDDEDDDDDWTPPVREKKSLEEFIKEGKELYKEVMSDPNVEIHPKVWNKLKDNLPRCFERDYKDVPKKEQKEVYLGHFLGEAYHCLKNRDWRYLVCALISFEYVIPVIRHKTIKPDPTTREIMIDNKYTPEEIWKKGAVGSYEFLGEEY